MLTDQQCKSMLVKAGLKHGVSPSLISTRLMSEEDKQDMRAGLIDQQVLDLHVEVWIKNKMPDYAKGHISPYTQFETVTRISPINAMGIGKQSKGLPGRI